MSALIGRPFLKMNGIGNNIVVLDLRGTAIVVSPAEARAVARAPGSHFDQLMALHDPRSPGTDAFMRIYNADGSESGACGNGTRCVGYALMRGGGREAVVLETQAARLPTSRAGEFRFTVDMGAPRFGWADIPLAGPVDDTGHVNLDLTGVDAAGLGAAAMVDMGNPHAIFWVDDVEGPALERIGPRLEHHPIFPERANISLAHVAGRDRIRLKVWERGVGLTRACGSAACAAAVAAARLGLTGRDVAIDLPGGRLRIAWRESDGHVLMTGDVELERESVFEPAVFAEHGGQAG